MHLQWKTVVLIIKIIVWIGALYISTLIHFQNIFFILTGLYLIFTNLGHRKKGSLSAYSVFNDNFQRMHGTMDGMSLFTGKQPDNTTIVIQKEEVPQQQSPSDLKEQFFRNESKYGNKPCYCGSNLKFKKCCMQSERKRLQQQRIKRIKGS